MFVDAACCPFAPTVMLENINRVDLGVVAYQNAAA
jgi:hypothetical protein